MAASDFETQVLKFMGSVDKAILNLEQSQRDQGQRIGTLEATVNKHLQQRNGNDWKVRGAYVGGGMVTFEFLHQLAKGIMKVIAQ